MNEQWRNIRGMKSYYRISNLARVWNLRTDRILKHLPNDNRYVMVMLRTELGRLKRCYVHILVAEAFLGERPSPKHEVAHWDNDRSNPVLTNLRWATKKENWADRIRHGTHTRGIKNGRCKLTEDEVKTILKLKKEGFTHRELNLRFNTRQAANICSGQSWKHLTREEG